MVSTLSPVYRFSVKCFAVGAIVVLAACSGDTNPVRDALVAVGAGPKTAATPDFVAQSRPTNLDYLPVGTETPPRPTKAKTADEVKAAEAEMDSLRAQNEAQGRTAVQAGATPAPEPAKVAPQRSAAPAKKKPPQTP
jgi:hypothetical protein